MKMRKLILLAAGTCVFVLQAQTIDQGRRQTRNEQYEDAGKTFDALITKKPKNGEPYYWSGINLLESGDTASAAAMFEKGLSLAPKYTLLNAGLGHIALRQGKTSDAERYFGLALKTGKKAVALANREVGRAYLMVTAGDPEVLRANASKAIEYLKKASSEDFEAQLLLGDAYSVANKLDQSQALQQYALSSYLNASDPRANLRQARVYQRVGNYDVSLYQVNLALGVDKEFAPAYRQKADVFNLMKQRDSAVYYYQEYLKRNNNLSARRMYAQALYLSKDFDQSITEAKNVIAAQKNSGQKVFTNLYGLIAYAYADKNDTSLANNKEGLSYFELYETNHIKPQNRPLSLSEMYVKANLLARTGSGDAAFAMHKEVLKDTAHCPEAWYQNIQDYYLNRKEYSRTVEVIELKRVKQGSLGSRDLFFLAESKYKTGNYQEALGMYRELIVKDTNYIQGYYKVANTLWVMDTFDVSGNVTPAYLTWINRMTLEQKGKYKSTMYDAYDKLQQIERRRKNYEQCSVYLGKMLEIYPDDEYAKKNKEKVDDYLKKVAAKKPKPAAGTRK